MIGILLITHAPLGHAFVTTAAHMFSAAQERVEAIDVAADQDPCEVNALAREAIARLDDNSCLAEARFSWGSVGPTVVRLPALEGVLHGAPPDAESIGLAVRMAHDGVSPISDLRASAAYRRRLAGNLLARFLEVLARSRV